MPVLSVLRTPLTDEDWRGLGVDAMRVGHSALETGPPGWGFSAAVDPGALPVPTWAAPLPDGGAPIHRSTVTGVDHVVLSVPSMAEAEQAILAALGLEPRRRASPRGAAMSFYRAGEAVLEVVESGRGPALSGVALRVHDMEQAVRHAADGLVGPPHPAIQGGQIASATKAWDGFTVAFYEKRPPDPAPGATLETDGR